MKSKVINLHIRNRIDKKEEKIYIVMSDATIEKQKGSISGKICCIIQKQSPDIVVFPGYSKTYLKDMFCNTLCDLKKRCCKNKWDDSCFINSAEDFNYNRVHITRHNTVLHYADNNKKLGRIRWERIVLSDFKKYEFIAGYSFLSKVLSSDIVKDYSKSKENEVVLLVSNGHNSFNVYVFISPPNNKELVDDLEKYHFEIAKYEYKEYDIVIGIQATENINQTAITGFTNMYISTHSNLGIGHFEPISL